MNKAKNAWLMAIIYTLIALALLITPILTYVYSHEDDFFVTGYLDTREVYSVDTSEIQAFLETNYPEAEENDFVRIIDTDSDWDYINGEWVNFEFQHAYVTASDFLFSFVVALIIIALVLLKALKNIDKNFSFIVWLVLIAFMLLFLKGILVYLPNLMFSVAGGWFMFYIVLKMAKRKWAIWTEYRNEKVRVEARAEAQG